MKARSSSRSVGKSGPLGNGSFMDLWCNPDCLSFKIRQKWYNLVNKPNGWMPHTLPPREVLQGRHMVSTPLPSNSLTSYHTLLRYQWIRHLGIRISIRPSSFPLNVNALPITPRPTFAIYIILHPTQDPSWGLEHQRHPLQRLADPLLQIIRITKL